jgi:ERCC4-related helicase
MKNKVNKEYLNTNESKILLKTDSYRIFKNLINAYDIQACIFFNRKYYKKSDLMQIIIASEKYVRMSEIMQRLEISSVTRFYKFLSKIDIEYKYVGNHKFYNFADFEEKYKKYVLI